jgi:hypothetical protein
MPTASWILYTLHMLFLLFSLFTKDLFGLVFWGSMFLGNIILGVADDRKSKTL